MTDSQVFYLITWIDYDIGIRSASGRAQISQDSSVVATSRKLDFSRSRSHLHKNEKKKDVRSELGAFETGPQAKTIPED